MSKIRTPDPTGSEFGHFEILGRTHETINNRRRVMWTCKCRCGTIKKVRKEAVVSGSISSCGCQKTAKIKGRRNRRTWKGCGDLGACHFNAMMKMAASRGIEAYITIEQAWELFVRQGGRCALTGLPLAMREPGSQTMTASLDRRDPEGPYSMQNCQWVHRIVNIMKNAFSQDDFIIICNQIARHNPDLGATIDFDSILATRKPRRSRHQA